jgi:hypothetical protein
MWYCGGVLLFFVTTSCVKDRVWAPTGGPKTTPNVCLFVCLFARVFVYLRQLVPYAAQGSKGFTVFGSYETEQRKVCWEPELGFASARGCMRWIRVNDPSAGSGSGNLPAVSPPAPSWFLLCVCVCVCFVASCVCVCVCVLLIEHTHVHTYILLTPQLLDAINRLWCCLCVRVCDG